ncbi:MAG: glycosyltransferase family 9 protein [Paracoccaceae bacterium]
MGLGGNLIWTGALKAIHDADGAPPVVCKKPGLSDLLSGVLWDRAVSLRDDQVFRLNPHLAFTVSEPKSELSRLVDWLFSLLIRPQFVQRAFENWISCLARERFKNGEARLVHVDMVIHSYAQAQTSRRMIWKQGGHASQIIAKGFGIENAIPLCEMVFSAAEEVWLDQFLNSMGLLHPFVVIEPGTNRDWFGSLRGWPRHRWESLTQRFGLEFPSMPMVQIGIKETPPIDGVIDLRGKTSFRQAALLIRQSSLFIGTEGGLMHAAKATDANALILWGGVTLPEFAGYPESQRVICHYVACAPCGNLGWCEKDRICMKSIGVDEVIKEIKQLLSAERVS